MEFLAPYALAGFVLAIPIVAFYILRVRLKRREVPTLMFWQEAFQERRLTAWWRRLRHLLSLFVQLLFLTLLVLAAARPLLPWEKRHRQDWSLLIDNSASMTARTRGGVSRLHQARRQALRWLERLPDEDRVAVLVTAPQPRVICPFTTHRGTIREAIQRIRPTHAPAQLERVVELARTLRAEEDRFRIVLFSDGCARDRSALIKSRDVEIVPIGTPTDNVGVARLAPRRSLLDPAQLQVLIEVRNFGESPVRTRVQIDLDDNPLDVLPVELEPHGVWRSVQEYLSEDGGLLRARLEHGGALSCDDTAWAVVKPLEEINVILVTEGNLFLEKVFEAMVGVRLSVQARAPAEPPADSVIVYHREVPEELPANPIIVIDPQSDCSLWQLGAEVHEPLVETVQEEHPLMAHVRLDQVLMPRARQLRFERTVIPLAATVSGEPLYALIERPGGDVLVLTADLDQGDLPLRTAFPIMMANALAWLTQGQLDAPEPVPTGQLARIAIDTSAGTQLMAFSPSGRLLRALPTTAGAVQFGPVDEAGLWRLQLAQSNDPAEALAQVAANLLEPAESDLRATWTEKEVGVAQPPRRLGGRSTWWYLAFVALGLTCIEWYLYQRRWIA